MEQGRERPPAKPGTNPSPRGSGDTAARERVGTAQPGGKQPKAKK